MEIFKNPAFLASSISFTIAPCVESDSLKIIKPSGYSDRLALKISGNLMLQK